MSRRLLLVRAAVVCLLIGSAAVVRYRFTPASVAGSAGVAPVVYDLLPGLDYRDPFLRNSAAPSVRQPAYFEEQTTAAEILQRLAQSADQPEAGGDLDTELTEQFQRREQSWFAEAQHGQWQLAAGESVEALAVSGSGSVVALAQGERCRLLDVAPSAPNADGLQLLERPAASALELPGRMGEELLLDHDGKNLVYLAAGGVVHAVNLQTRAVTAIDAAQLRECTFLGGGLSGGWMVAATRSGDVILFNLQGSVLRSQKLERAEHAVVPELCSVACDPEGQVVLAGYHNRQLRWFRRQGDRLVVDGGLTGFPGSLQSVAINESLFAVGGESFFFVSPIPRPGKPIDVQRSWTRKTVHQQTWVALAEGNQRSALAIWGETASIRSERRTAWLYAVDTPSGQMDRPFHAAIAETSPLRGLSPSGALLVAAKDDRLILARPPGIKTTPPASFAEMIRRLLAANDYEELDRCTRYLGDPQRRRPELQYQWILCLSSILLPPEGDYRLREKRLLQWLDECPGSLTAWLALAQHYLELAWAARGPGVASEVDESGWEILGRDLPKSDRIVRSFLARSSREPAVFALAAELTAPAGWTPSERAKLSALAIELFAADVVLHNKLAFYRLPRWGGSGAQAVRHIEAAAQAIDEPWQDIHYATLAVDLMERHAPHLGDEQVPVDYERLWRGLSGAHPQGHSAALSLYRLAQDAALEGKIDVVAFYLEQAAADSPLLPDAIPLVDFLQLSRAVRTDYPVIRARMQQAAVESLRTNLQSLRDWISPDFSERDQ